MVTKIGVIGHCASPFDKIKAQKLLQQELDKYSEHDQVKLVSGMTNVGIPFLAYEEAKKRNWKTVGVASNKAYGLSVYPCDEKIFVGEKWGDENEYLLDQIDLLIRIGGGHQSAKQTELAKQKNIPIKEIDLSN